MGSLVGGGGGLVEGGRGSLPSLPSWGEKGGGAGQGVPAQPALLGGKGGGGLCTQSLIICLSCEGLQGTFML
jgi:hypothetical protein